MKQKPHKYDIIGETPKGMEIRSLIEQSRAGNTQAFGELYDLFADKIFRFIKLKVKDLRQAEDILQDVFVKAWQALPKLPLENLNFNAWLYKVTSNTINDYFRKMYRAPEITELTDTLDIASNDNPAAAAQAASDASHINLALAELPSQYRQVLELRFIQDFSISETANILGKTNLAVRLLQHRALKQLQKTVKQENNLA
jgi:RNA polymerase sigma-70 factor, ECF subfamily